MTYPYGTKGAPAVGGGLPGLPRRGASARQFRLPQIIDIQEGSGELVIPSGWIAARITAVGGGAAGFHTGSGGRHVGGGSGALCGTDVILLNGRSFLVEYQIGKRGEKASGLTEAAWITRSGGDTIVKALGYELFAGGGKSILTSSDNASGGTASGGDRNFDGRTASGSTYASIGMNGAPAPGPFGRTGEGSGAAQTMAVGGNLGAGGGGAMGYSGRNTSGDLMEALPPFSTIEPYPKFPGSDAWRESGAGTANSGGDWGGGGGTSTSSTGSSRQGLGGRGGLRIELW